MFLCPKCQQPMRIVKNYDRVGGFFICHHCLSNNKKDVSLKVNEKKIV